MLTRQTQTGCTIYQDDLAGFIDYEAEADTSAALQCYPHVWWHLLNCAACATTYQMTRALLDAERRGTLPALPTWKAHASSPALLMTLRLTRTFLRYALPAPSRLVDVARGASDGMVLIDQTSDIGRNLSLYVREQADGFWIVAVTVTPALDGWLCVTLGEVILRARFNSTGTAIINDVPAASLTGAHGPDLVLDIEAHTVAADS